MAATKSSRANKTKAETTTSKKNAKTAKQETENKAPGRTKKEGLRGPQERILKLLKSGKEYDRKTIAEKAPCDLANCTELLGSHIEEKRLTNDEKYYPSLISLGYVKASVSEGEGKATVTYTITAAGKKAAEKLS